MASKKVFFDNAEYYIIKIVLIITTAIVGIAFLFFAIYPRLEVYSGLAGLMSDAILKVIESPDCAGS